VTSETLPHLQYMRLGSWTEHFSGLPIMHWWLYSA